MGDNIAIWSCFSQNLLSALKGFNSCNHTASQDEVAVSFSRHHAHVYQDQSPSADRSRQANRPAYDPEIAKFEGPSFATKIDELTDISETRRGFSQCGYFNSPLACLAEYTTCHISCTDRDLNLTEASRCTPLCLSRLPDRRPPPQCSPRSATESVLIKEYALNCTVVSQATEFTFARLWPEIPVGF